MTRLHRLLSAFALGIVIFGGSSAWALPRMSLVGGIDYTTYSADTATGDTVKGKPGLTAGLLLEFPMARRLSLEIGGLYIKRTVTLTTAQIDTSYNLIHLPISLRFWLARMLSIGLGGYYELPASGGRTNVYGLEPEARIDLPIGSADLMIDARYLYGFKDPGLGLGDYRGIVVLAGLTFRLGR